MQVACIIPVYNASRYLRRCINSVLNQSYKDVHAVLVNDCSKDNSGDICSEYAHKYPQRIKFIDKPVNEGVDKARFTGLNYVLCDKEHKWGGVMFLDSDDYLECRAVENLVEAMLANNSDIVQMRANRFFGLIKKPYFAPLSPQTIHQPELFDEYYKSFFGINLLDVWMCAKLYNTETLRKANLKPSGFKMGEDLMFNLKLFPYLKTWTLIQYRGYNYRVGGLTSKYNPTLWHDLKEQYEIKRKEAEVHGYVKAYRTLGIELKNILLSEVTQRIFYLHETDESLLAWIKREIDDKNLWRDVIAIGEDNNDPAITAIISGNPHPILDIVKQRMRKQRIKLAIKKLLIKVLG